MTRDQIESLRRGDLVRPVNGRFAGKEFRVCFLRRSGRNDRLQIVACLTQGRRDGQPGIEQSLTVECLLDKEPCNDT